MKKYIIILFVAGLWMFTSCGNKLDLAPENAITQEEIDELLASGDQDAIDLVVGGLASSIPGYIHRTINASDSRNNSFLNLQYMNDLQGYDIVVGKDVQTFGFEAYSWIGKNGRGPTSSFNTSYWALGWKAVTEANRLLAMLSDDVVGDNTTLKGYKAVALTLRAYAYNYLMENYRDAYTANGLGLMIYDENSTDYEPFSTAGETYDFIKEDLTKAITLFGESGLGENGDGYTANTQDFDMAVAKFLQARVSLLTGDYSTAISACNDILARYSDFIAVENYGGKNTGTDAKPVFYGDNNAFFNKDKNPEVIFGFPDDASATNYVSVWMNCFGLGYGGSTGEYSRIVNTLYDKIADTDVRKDAFMSGTTTFANYKYPNADSTLRTVPAYTNLKFAATHGKDRKKETVSVGTSDDCYMRTSEVLLMKAEAQAKNNDESGAKTTLNTLLAARSTGSTVLTCDNYGMSGSALDMVKLQWRIEMWGENGLEYYNNKRWGVEVVRSTSTTDHRINATIGVSLMTLDIPDNEYLYNPNLN